jgi:hypothetical protein
MNNFLKSTCSTYRQLFYIVILCKSIIDDLAFRKVKCSKTRGIGCLQLSLSLVDHLQEGSSLCICRSIQTRDILSLPPVYPPKHRHLSIHKPRQGWYIQSTIKRVHKNPLFIQTTTFKMYHIASHQPKDLDLQLPIASATSPAISTAETLSDSGI